MDSKAFAKEALKVTLKSVDRSPNDWITFNDKIHTQILDEIHPLKSSVLLLKDEVPILECVLDDSFVVITTHRLISRIGPEYAEIPMNAIHGFSGENERANYNLEGGPQPKIHIITVRVAGERKIRFQIDSYYPAYFARLLIYNISCYLRIGKWYVNSN